MKLRSKKLLLLGILSLALCLSAPLWKTLQANAAEVKSTSREDKNDPEYYKYHSDTYGLDKVSGLSRSYTIASEQTTTFSGGLDPFALCSYTVKNAATGKSETKYKGIEFLHNIRYQNCTILHGIDVSKWQGYDKYGNTTIDWEKVKAAGIDYAFIRCGFSGISNGKSATDPAFVSNIKNAYAAGIKIGIYYYSQSKTTTEAVREANYTLSLIEPYRSYITLPVVYDFEMPSTSRAANISKTQVTNNTIAFCDTIINAGYQTMYYGSPSFLTTNVNVSKLGAYDCWLANYCAKTTQSFATKYTGNYLFWQYSDFGTVDGISGSVDMNFYYVGASTATTTTTTSTPTVDKVTGFKQKTNTATSVTLTWTKDSDATGYQIYRSTAPNGSYSRVKTISSKSTVSWKNTSLKKNTQYYYKIRAYKTVNGKNYYSSYSSVVAGHTKAYSGKYKKTTAALNVRSYPGTAYSKKATLAKKKKVKLVYATKAKDGSTWYKISWSGNTGYVCGKYLK